VVIRSATANRIATASTTVTSPTGVFIMVRSRSKSSHAGNDANGKAADYPANGIAIETLIDSTVSVTTRHSENAPIASVAAMALVNREEATGAGRLPKPTVPSDRIMVKFLQDTGESPATSGNLTDSAGNIAAFPAWKARNRRKC
jgi:hypothetical protein